MCYLKTMALTTYPYPHQDTNSRELWSEFQGTVLLGRTLATQSGMTIKWLVQRGPSPCESYGLSITMLDEPPSADPYARWCGVGGIETCPYPFICCYIQINTLKVKW
jgi:hypothetical protein